MSRCVLFYNEYQQSQRYFLLLFPSESVIIPLATPDDNTTLILYEKKAEALADVIKSNGDVT